MKTKPRIGLLTSTIDGRRGRGTALVARKLLEELLVFRDRFDFTLVHHEKSNDSFYTKYKEVLIPKLPEPFNRQFLRETAFWLTKAPSFDLFHYLHPRLWPSYLFTTAPRIIVNGIEGGHMLPTNHHESFLFRLTSRFLNGKMDIVTASSESGRQEIIDTWHIPSSSVIRIYLGVDKHYAPLTDQNTLVSIAAHYHLPQRYVLAVSRFDPHKNILGILAAYKQFSEHHPDIHLVLVGGFHTKEYSAACEAVIARLNKTALRVQVISFVEDAHMPALYSGAEMLIYPSLHEGFGLPMVEAMACGTPVITSNVSSLPEVAGGAALVVNPHDHTEIAHAMERLIDDPALRLKLIERGLQNASRFSWKRAAEETVALYDRLLKKTKSPGVASS